MISPQRLVLCVEGPGDRAAVPVLVKRLLTNANAWASVILDKDPMMVGEAGSLMKSDGKEWKRYLGVARKGRKPLGAVLLLLDGDAKRIQGESFCARTHAAKLAVWAENEGGGKLFSVAVVFVRQEYESWFVACAEQLAGKSLPDGRDGLPAGTSPPDGDPEDSPRNAKKWLAQRIPNGYKESADQAAFTQLLIHHLDAPRLLQMRSFRRFKNAVQLLSEAIGSGTHLVSPYPGTTI